MIWAGLLLIASAFLFWRYVSKQVELRRANYEARRMEGEGKATAFVRANREEDAKEFKQIFVPKWHRVVLGLLLAAAVGAFALAVQKIGAG
jgi:hypothetical protein